MAQKKNSNQRINFLALFNSFVFFISNDYYNLIFIPLLSFLKNSPKDASDLLQDTYGLRYEVFHAIMDIASFSLYFSPFHNTWFFQDFKILKKI